MKQNRILFSALLGAMLACFPSCKSSTNQSAKKKIVTPSAKQMIKINIVSEPYKLDPRQARSLKDINLTKMFMEGLTRLKKNDEPTMAAAESVQVSEDGTIYTFKIRTSKWSNGDPVTSYDFAYSWKRVLSPDFPAEKAHELFVIKNAADIKNGDLPVSLLGVSCPDEKTLVITLEHPVPYLTKLVAQPVFFPVNQQNDKKNQNWAFSFETYVGNGPFMMESWNHHNKITAVKNPGYWDHDNVKLEKIEMLMVSEDTGLKMFENNELQWDGAPLSAIPADSIDALKKMHLLNSIPALGTHWIQTNTQKAPLTSTKLRKAFALAINRQELVDLIMKGNHQPTTGIVPMSMGLQNEPYFKDGDFQAALSYLEEGLKEVDLTKEDINSIRLSYIDEEYAQKMAQALQQQWFETLGVLVKLEPLDASVYKEKIESGDFDLACTHWTSDIADPIAFLEVFSPNSSIHNSTKWTDPLYQESLQSSFICKDQLGRETLLRNAEKMIIEAMPVIPLFNHSLLYVKDNRVKSVELSSAGQIDFKWAYVDTI
ncbi:MAG: peptide ABC transporter substrate-binding protein [Simkaniaceae bacterium]|nr:peptide ABC transporter substrate-binding protein [Simkaniaceae bacterium]MCF7852141.1 peptide ABC transporter substrate-binding protein [Simkaniaceae bacterium]